MDWDDAYSNSRYIEGGDAFYTRWLQAAQEFRNSWPHAELDQPYGPHPLERFDLFSPDTVPLGLLIFVHGGYWQETGKSTWSHLAAGPLKRGWAVALPGYTQCPAVKLDAIAPQIGRAVTAIAERVKGPIILSGHSAGGHLVSRMVCADSPLPDEVRCRLAKIVSISGLHDLNPLLLTKMREPLGLDAAMAARESPALLKPLDLCPVVAWVGGDERPEFIRQSRLLQEAWNAKLVVEPHRHHFDVIESADALLGATP